MPARGHTLGTFRPCEGMTCHAQCGVLAGVLLPRGVGDAFCWGAAAARVRHVRLSAHCRYETPGALQRGCLTLSAPQPWGLHRLHQGCLTLAAPQPWGLHQGQRGCPTPPTPPQQWWPQCPVARVSTMGGNHPQSRRLVAARGRCHSRPSPPCTVSTWNEQGGCVHIVLTYQAGGCALC